MTIERGSKRCRLCGNEIKGDMEDAMAHLMTEHDADPNEDFIIED